jgi:hypothetical protein
VVERISRFEGILGITLTSLKNTLMDGSCLYEKDGNKGKKEKDPN